MNYEKATCRIFSDGDLNTHGTVDIDGVRRLYNGKYQVRVRKDSENRPVFWSEEFRTNEVEPWLGIHKTVFGQNRNKHLPKLNIGETVIMEKQFGGWIKQSV